MICLKRTLNITQLRFILRYVIFINFKLLILSRVTKEL